MNKYRNKKVIVDDYIFDSIQESFQKNGRNYRKIGETKEMTREDLKNYKYTQEWIKDRAEHIKEYETSITNITSVLSDMPKRK